MYSKKDKRRVINRIASFRKKSKMNEINKNVLKAEKSITDLKKLKNELKSEKPTVIGELLPHISNAWDNIETIFTETKDLIFFFKDLIEDSDDSGDEFDNERKKKKHKREKEMIKEIKKLPTPPSPPKKFIPSPPPKPKQNPIIKEVKVKPKTIHRPIPDEYLSYQRMIKKHCPNTSAEDALPKNWEEQMAVFDIRDNVRMYTNKIREEMKKKYKKRLKKKS
jgi:hypothetical protein